MKKFLFVIFCLFSVAFADSYYHQRDYISEFYSKEEGEYIRSWNYHSGEVESHMPGITVCKTKEVIISNYFKEKNKVFYSDKDFMGTLIHETIHVVLYYRNEDTDADGHGLAFMNEAFRMSQIFQNTSIPLSTREICGGIYEAKMIQLHSKGIYTDEDIYQETQRKIQDELKKNNPKPAVTLTKNKTKQQNAIQNQNIILNDCLGLNFMLGYTPGHNGAYGMSQLFASYFTVGSEMEYTSEDSFMVGASLGLQLPLAFDDVKIIPSIKGELSLNWPRSDFYVDIGGIVDMTIMVSAFSVYLGAGFYKEKPMTFIIGGGLGFCE